MVSVKNRLLLASSFCLSVALYLLMQALPLCTVVSAIITAFYASARIPYMLLGLVLMCTAGVLVDVVRHKPPPSQTIVGSLCIYTIIKLLSITAWVTKYRFLRDRFRIESSQRRLLAEILSRAKETLYGQQYKLDEMSVEEFRKMHPLTDYHHYKPWIERVLKGEHNVLFAEQVDFIAVTSGTTSGKSKAFPINISCVKARLRMYLMNYTSLFQVPATKHLNYVLDFRFRSKTSIDGSGIRKGPLSSIFNQQFYFIEHIPFVAKKISDLQVALYVNMVFATKQRDIGILLFPFGSQAYAFFRCMEVSWRYACADIRRGRLEESITIEEEGVLEELNAALTPDPQRADELELLFAAGHQDIVPRIWPGASVLWSILTGSFTVYRQLLQKRYLGSVPVACSPHFGTESIYGINIWPEPDRRDEYIACHNVNFFEFVPEKNVEEKQPPTFFLHQLEVGERYEVVVTTKGGFYRYRTNDIITVRGFEGQIPTYAFAQRADDTLSVFAEKTPVCVVTEVVERVFAGWPDVTLVNYAITESPNLSIITGGRDMRYILMVELIGEELTLARINELDEKLQANADRYRHYRQAGQLEDLRVMYLQKGAFDKLRDYLLASNKDASAFQVKVPRRPTNEKHLRVLLDM